MFCDILFTSNRNAFKIIEHMSQNINTSNIILYFMLNQRGHTIILRFFSMESKSPKHRPKVCCDNYSSMCLSISVFYQEIIFVLSAQQLEICTLKVAALQKLTIIKNIKITILRPFNNTSSTK